MLLPPLYAFCRPVFDATGALALIAAGQEGTFDIRWGGEIDVALRDCAQWLSYELGYDRACNT